MFKYWLLLASIGLMVGCSPESPSVIPNTQAMTPVKLRLPPEFQNSDDKQNEAAAKAEYEQIDAGFKKAMAELRALIGETKSKKEQAQLLLTRNPAPVAAVQYIKLARKYPNTKSAVDAVLFAVGQTRGEQKNEAMTLLLERYCDKVQVGRIADSLLKEIPSPDIEGWFQLLVKNAESGADKAKVIVTYAKYVGQLPVFKRSIELSEGIAERLPAKQLEYINAERSETQRNQLAELLQNVIDQYGELKYKGRTTYGEAASRELFDLQRLQVGMVAPEIEGSDLDEVPFKLSDYRGKVVMLDFWGHWCPPCRAMYPHEQEITRKLADKPFVLLGVNSDADLGEAREAVSSENLSWRHFWNGPTGTRGPISTQWNVEGWPTVYLIDQAGVIRYKSVLGEDIDRGIEVLMEEMGHQVNLTESPK